jgi:SAM-dependent methyltransferase
LSVVSRIRQYQQRQAFLPGWLGIVANPSFIIRRDLARAVKAAAGRTPGGTLLDVGCGIKPYKSLFQVHRYVGLDVPVSGHRDDGKHNDVFFDGLQLPIQSASVDTVLATEVLEHVFEPDRFMSELSRVARPGGALILTVPFAWYEHEQPHDYGRYTSFGLRALVTRHGFDVVQLSKTAGYVLALAQLASSYVMKRALRRGPVAQIAAQLFLCAPIMLCGVIADAFLPGDSDLYLSSVLVARRRS